MTDDTSRVPKLRFPGFTGAWEQRKLGELENDGRIRLGRGHVISAKDVQQCPGQYPIYSASAKHGGEMGQYGHYMFDQELVTWSIDGGGSVFYRPKHKYSVTNVCGFIDANSSIDTAFLAYQMGLRHSRLHFDYTVKAHPSVIRNLYYIGIPSLPEQRCISSLFGQLDNLITLHQRKQLNI
jgi:type I restriction enzyme S subunit